MANELFLLIFTLITIKYLVFLALFAHKLLNIGGIYSPTALDIPTDKDSYRDVWTYLKMALFIGESVPN